MVAETRLRASPTRNGRCLEARNASRNMVARKSQAKSPLSDGMKSLRKGFLEEVFGGIATFRWHGKVSDRPGERSGSFLEERNPSSRCQPHEALIIPTPGLKSADRHFTREPTTAADGRRVPLTRDHNRVVEDVSREIVGCRRRDMVAEKGLRASRTRNGRCLEARNASRNMVARKSQAKTPLSDGTKSHRKVF